MTKLQQRGICFGLWTLCLASPALAFDPKSPFGVTAFIPSPTRWQAMQDAMIVWNRCQFSWRDVETSQDVFNWSQTDQMVTEANNRGLSIYAGLGYTPTWASSGGQSYSPPLSTADWTSFCTIIVNRYKASIHHWEIWNEPNLGQFWGGTRQQYISNILIPAADAIHAADPTAKVLACELSSCCSASTWMTDVLNQAGSRIDIISHHQYDGGDTPSGRLAGIDSMHTTVVNAGYGSKETWVTECGWESDSIGEQAQANNLVAMLKGMETRPWWRNFMWYQIWEGPTGRAGLLYQNETRKPSWYAYRDYVFASNWGPQTPFGGTARTVPGLIQAEDFDNGGPGVGYKDADATNNGGQYRLSEQVDVEGCADTGGGYNVGHTAAGEFLKYTINVTSAGNYNIQLRVAAAGALAGTYHIQVGGINKTAVLSMPVTGGWQTWQTTTVNNVALSAGQQVLKFYVDSGGFNLNWINVVSAGGGGGGQAPFGGTARTIPGTIQAEDFDTGGEGVAYHDNESTNLGGQYRTSEGVDIEPTSDTGGGYNIGYTNGAEWLEYTVNVNNTGDHTFKLRIASCCSSGNVTLKMNNNTIANSKVFASTGGWQNWTTILVPAVFLNAGSNQILQVFLNNGNLNFNKLDVSYGGADAIHVDLDSTVFNDGMDHIVCCDGSTTGASIGGHNCRRNVTPTVDGFMYFAVADIYSFQGSRPDLWISAEYYDTGTGFVQLQYDATSSPYKSAANVNFANSNTWKVAQWHVTDAYFGNRQNGGADYRIARGQNTTWYLDTVQTSMSQP